VAISYPITLPFTTKTSNGIEFMPDIGVGTERSPYSGVENVQDGGRRIMRVRIDLPPMTRADGAAAWVAALRSLDGPLGTFYLGDTAWKTPRGTATGTPLVKGASQTGEDLITDGWTAGVTGIMKAADWIQLGTGTSARHYMVVADANSNGSGEATLTLRPKLRSSPADNAAIVVTGAVGVFRLAVAPGWSIGYDQLAQGLSFMAVEALNP
jgi:hypothetical protein